MKSIYQTALLFIITLFLTQTSLAQENKVTIRFIGNCGLHMTDGTTTIYTDFPYKSGAYGYMKFSKAELDSIQANSIFIFTHIHADHYSGKNMRSILKEKGSKKFTPRRMKKLKKHAKKIPDFDIQIIKTKHRFSLKHVSYLITWHGKKIFLSGDTESAQTAGELKDIDWAFIPSWILLDAKEKNIQIDAKRKAVYHLYPNQKTKPQENTIFLNKTGETISISF